MEQPFFSEYFAALNSGVGFKSYFSSVLDGVSKITILKGSPGSGKSSLMKKIAEATEKNGKKAERLYCSSDPDSLDGVVIREDQTAVIDGTAPHTADPKYPVVAETIFDTADFLNENKLTPRKNEIISLSTEKSRLFEQGYKLLSCRGVMRELRHSMTDGSILYEKMLSFVKRTIKKELRSSSAVNREKSPFSISVRVSASFNGNGICVKNTFSSAEKVYLLNDKHDIAPIMLNMITGEARSASEPIVISPDPFDPNMVCALYLQNSKTLFIVDRYAPVFSCRPVTVNCERFIDKTNIRSCKTRLKFLNGTILTLETAAKESFAEAKIRHAKLEEIYTPAMDFAKLSEKADELVKRLLIRK